MVFEQMSENSVRAPRKAFLTERPASAKSLSPVACVRRPVMVEEKLGKRRSEVQGICFDTEPEGKSW